jgi:hypothetical protein
VASSGISGHYKGQSNGADLADVSLIGKDAADPVLMHCDEPLDRGKALLESSEILRRFDCPATT